MAFWSTEKLRREGAGLIKPYTQKFVKHGAYELAFGPEAFISANRKRSKLRLKRGDEVAIPPGQFALLLTEESVTVPDDAIGFISIRFSIKMRGLINVSGFHVDPGFSGRLKFAVYNAGSQKIILSRGDRIFLIWFSDLCERTKDVYSGVHDHQSAITSADMMFLQGELASPAELKKQLDKLKIQFRIWQGVFITLLTGIIIGVVVLVLRMYFEKPTAPSTPPAQYTISKEAVQDSKHNEPIVNEKTDNSANKPGNIPTHTPERKK